MNAASLGYPDVMIRLAMSIALLLPLACSDTLRPGAHGTHTDHASHHPNGGSLTNDGKQHDHDFSDVERFATMFDDPERDAWQMPAHVVEHLSLSKGMTVVDLGAGTGYFVPHLSAGVGPEGRVLALDVEPKMIAHMRERFAASGISNIETRVVAPGDPGLPNASVDRILIVNTWHHIADRASYIRRLHEALRRDGTILIVDFTQESPHGPPAHLRLGADDLVDELEAAGLEVTILEESLPYQYVVLVR